MMYTGVRYSGYWQSRYGHNFSKQYAEPYKHFHKEHPVRVPHFLKRISDFKPSFDRQPLGILSNRNSRQQFKVQPFVHNRHSEFRRTFEQPRIERVQNSRGRSLGRTSPRPSVAKRSPKRSPVGKSGRRRSVSPKDRSTIARKSTKLTGSVGMVVRESKIVATGKASSLKGEKNSIPCKTVRKTCKIEVKSTLPVGTPSSAVAANSNSVAADNDDVAKRKVIPKLKRRKLLSSSQTPFLLQKYAQKIVSGYKTEFENRFAKTVTSFMAGRRHVFSSKQLRALANRVYVYDCRRSMFTIFDKLCSRFSTSLPSLKWQLFNNEWLTQFCKRYSAISRHVDGLNGNWLFRKQHLTLKEVEECFVLCKLCLKASSY